MYLSNEQILQMAHTAANTYEMTASWSDAKRAAAEHCIDEFHARPRKSQVLLALKLARCQWESQVISTKKAINNDL